LEKPNCFSGSLDPNNCTNWCLSTPEKDRRNDFEMITRQGDMPLQEATMKLNAG
jgi:hypothetical protein